MAIRRFSSIEILDSTIRSRQTRENQRDSNTELTSKNTQKYTHRRLYSGAESAVGSLKKICSQSVHTVYTRLKVRNQNLKDRTYTMCITHTVEQKNLQCNLLLLYSRVSEQKYPDAQRQNTTRQRGYSAKAHTHTHAHMQHTARFGPSANPPDARQCWNSAFCYGKLLGSEKERQAKKKGKRLAGWNSFAI